MIFFFTARQVFPGIAHRNQRQRREFLYIDPASMRAPFQPEPNENEFLYHTTSQSKPTQSEEYLIGIKNNSYESNPSSER